MITVNECCASIKESFMVTDLLDHSSQDFTIYTSGRCGFFIVLYTHIFLARVCEKSRYFTHVFEIILLLNMILKGISFICRRYVSVTLVVVQSLSRHVQLLGTPWTAAHQASLFFTISPSLYKLMSIEPMMPSSHLILCHPFVPFSSCPQSFPASGSFPMSQSFASGGQSIGAPAPVRPMSIQG